MTATCPHGHRSATTDYCDQCGARIGGTTEPAPTPQPTGVLPVLADPPVPADPCPDCGAARIGGDRYCESCGHDFTTGAPRVAAPDAQPASTAAWEALVSADRDRFERGAPDGVEFPADFRPLRLALVKPEVRIGRCRPSGQMAPDVEIAGAAGDPGVSRLHAILVRQDDGSYAIVDKGSTNGTTINDDPARIPPDVPLLLTDGDRIHLGAWTTLTLRLASGGERPQ